MGDLLLAALLGVIEGLTEFLPVSSTGHLTVASALLNFPPEKIRTTFDIFIQIGAVFAVIIYYSRDLIKQAQHVTGDRGVQRFWLNILIAFLPAAVIALLFEKQIDQLLRAPVVVGISLVVGGIIFLLIERQPRKADIHDIQKVSPVQALAIGIAQAVAIIPGVSRSGASIVGGLLVGLDRVTATAFSFYLFIPTLGAATLYKLYSAFKDKLIDTSQLPLLIVGTIVAFIVSYASIAWLVRYVSSHSFRAFGVYRILAGAFIIILALFTTLLR